ncbi:MAG: hypothetical protein OQJ81_10680 [Melioribacteraceae bacterium]|nr:hypothetical protein [Melioribacteraceae bacterium]
MNQEKKQLFEEFSKESLLYLDGDLPKDRMEFWDKKLLDIPELNKVIEDYHKVSEIFSQPDITLSDDKFDLMIDKAISKKSMSSRFTYFINNLFSVNMEFAFGKLAFTSVLIIAAIFISILSDKPSPVIKVTENISAEILDWDADFVDSQISKVSNLLKVSEDEEYRKYYRYKKASSNVDKNLNLITNSIEELKTKINNKKL